MSLTITLVHAPSALAPGEWRRLHHRAGRLPHELRLSLRGIPSPSGAQIRSALSRWLQEQLDDGRGRPGPALQMTVGGTALESLGTGSAQIHPGMVVLLGPQEQPPGPGPRSRQEGGAFTLRLCIDRGPDAGRLLPLRRGSRSIGRSAEIAVADPAMGRVHAHLRVGDRGIFLMEQDRERPWTAGEAEQLGRSTFRLVSAPPLPSSGRWTTPPEPVTEKPPEGKHRMMLLMALVPLVVGIVLVTMTGMWFFLLFSAVSALVALATVLDAARRRRRYRRALEQAARSWGRARDAALPTPGQLAQTLREGLPPHLPEDSVRLGTGQIVAELEAESGSAEDPPATAVCAGAALPLGQGGRTMLRGHRREVLRLLRWVLLQLLSRPAGSRAPILLVDDGALSPPAEAGDIRGFSVLPSTAGERELPDSLLQSAEGILLHTGEDSRRPLLERALAQGWHVISCSYSTAAPRQHSSGQQEIQVVDLSAGTLSTGVSAPSGAETHGLQPDGLSAQTFAELLRLALPRCAGSSEPSGIPRQHDAALPEPLMARSARRSLKAELGRGPDGPEELDLVNDGPHILLAGTSGSGKSELLKSLMLGWAAAYGPEEVNFVLVDFKGGSTFQRIAQLEHSLGLVTDLSQAQAERTLEGIHSELKRRERLFLDAGAGDYAEYRRTNPQAPLARILVVIDEFRIFSHELPDTMDELMRLATLGRSLGLHLVLATQRPQGVVTADIRANIGAIITLRLRGEDESENLVGTKAAGHIPRDLPGRGIIRRPGEQPRPFQSARLSSGTEQLTALPEAQEEPAEPEAEWTDAAPQIVQLLSEASPARRRPHTPLLPPLPQQLPASAGAAAVLGLVDDPARQSRWELTFSPSEPQSIALIGEGGSGGAQALAALTAQLLSGQEEAHLYLLDGDRSLERFRSHPRVGSWVTEEHMPELEHLLAALKEELTARRMGRGSSRVPLVILMSGHAQWHMAAQSAGPGLMDHMLGTLIGEGAEAGFSAVISGGRELVGGKLGARIPHRIYLPYGVSEDTSFMWPKLRPVDGQPGRGVWIGPRHPVPGLEVQLVSGQPGLSPEPELPARPPAEPMIRVRPLPEEVPAAELPPSDGTPVVGLAQFTHAPVRMELGPVNLILGSRGTGRSSCLRLMAQQLGDRAASWEGLPAEGASSPEILLIDDAGRLSAEDHLRVERLIQEGVKVVAAAEPGTGVFAALPWAHRARGGPGNMLLSPTHRSQGDAFAVSAPVLSRPQPGRAVLLRPEKPMMLQWALPAPPAVPAHPAALPSHPGSSQ